MSANRNAPDYEMGVSPTNSPHGDAADYEKAGDYKNNDLSPQSSEPGNLATARDETKKKSLAGRTWAYFKTPGSALQIIAAAVLAVAIGLAVTFSVDQADIPVAAPEILELPGVLWLRALRAVVLPLIVTAIILAVQNLKEMASGGAKLARYTILYYVITTIFAIVQSMILVDLVWVPLMTVVDEETQQIAEEDQDTIDSRADQEAHDIVINLFTSFIPQNVVNSLANDELLAVLITATVVGYLIKGPDSPLLRAVREVDRIVFIVIDFLIKLAPIGVFFLILGNLLVLDVAEIGVNLGVLIGASVVSMAIHLFVVLPLIFFGFLRKNPYAYWMKGAPAWITAWGSASSAATLPVTMRVLRERRLPETIVKFTAPLGCLINMDGTAIYFPIVVVFLAVTTGQPLNVGDYALIVILSTLSSIATTPIPSSSLVLTVIIATSVGIEITGMYAVVVAIDWFIDRFRTMTNVSGDIFAAPILQKLSGITDDDDNETNEAQATLDRMRATAD